MRIFIELPRATLSVFAAVITVGMLGASGSAAEPAITGFGAPLDGGSLVVPARAARTALTAGSTCGVQFRSTIAAKGVQLWYVKNVSHVYNVGWFVMADTTSPGPSVSLATTATQQTDSAHATYWLGIANYATTSQTFEMRYCVQ